MDEIFFSIVIPVWNREKSIIRCLNSIVNQAFGNYEIIVVNDASTDETRINVEKFIQQQSNIKIYLINLKDNKGVCYARNRGTILAKGEWVISLDSDWTLLPGTLEKFYNMAVNADDQIGVIGGMAKLDTGEVIPENLFPDNPFGFIDYIKWIDKTKVSDYQPCRRKKIFENITWPSDLRLETKFHLDVSNSWEMWIINDVVAVSHTDCANRWTTDKSKSGVDSMIKRAPFIAIDSEEILEQYGDLLLKDAPNFYYRILYKASYFNFWSGNKAKGVKYGLKAWSKNPKSINMIFIVITGVFGPGLMYKIKTNYKIMRLYKIIYERICG